MPRTPHPGGYPVVRRRRKFGNVPTMVDGIQFDSKWEAEHYRELRLRQAAGEIRDLACHVPFILTVHGTPIGTYVADFVYATLRDGLPVCPLVIEDTKSEPTRRTASYRLKRKIMAARGHDIVEVLRPVRASVTARRTAWEARVATLTRRAAKKGAR